MPSTSTIAALAPQVQSRLQDPNGTFWLQQYEVYAGLAEAISQLLLIVGRPTTYFNQLVSLSPNTVWQAIPSGVLAITDINLAGKRLKKTTLHALDYTQSSWTSSWESDRADAPYRWAPLGLNLFVVHPAPVQPLDVTVTGIAYPLTDPWPPTGAESSPFETNIDQALQMFAAFSCRVKECGEDAQEGFALYQAFLEIAQRYTRIQDRRDSLVWTRSIGVPTAPSQVSHR